jgi:transcription elongation GreA/GreB family factor
MNYLYITPKDKEKIEQGIADLKRYKELFSKKLGEAAAHGGSFPQGIPEYVVLENKIHRLEDEMQILSKILHQYEVADLEKFPKNIITTRTLVKAEKGDDVEALYIIEPFLAKDSPANPVSPKSPIGSAFMGKKIKQTVKVKLPIGESTYKIVGIRKV